MEWTVGTGAQTNGEQVTYITQVVDERRLEVPVEFKVIILEYVLQAALGTVLCQDTHIGRVDTGSQERDQILMAHLTSLNTTIIDKRRLNGAT